MSTYHLTIEYNICDASQKTPWGTLAGKQVYLSHHPSVQIHTTETESDKLCLMGHPFIGDAINLQAFAHAYQNSSRNEAVLRQINGEFLLVELRHDALRIVNSRFATPLFWYVFERGLFLGSTSYAYLSQRLQTLNLLNLRPEVFGEFLYFKRLFRDKTYDKRTRYLKPASCLSLDGSHLNVVPYWHLHYSPNRQSLSKNVVTLSKRIRQAIKRKCSDDKRYGLFLSGGMDTRTLLAHFDTPPHCFTMTHAENRELAVARQLAQWKGAQHTWIPIQQGHYRKYLDQSVQLRASMYMPDALFLGHRDRLAAEVDVLFAGYGFDYFFQGMYLPVKVVSFGGKDTLYKKLAQLPEKLADYFFSQISYRVKGPSLFALVKPEKRADMEAFMMDEIEDLIQEACEITDDPYAIWEYLSLGYVSRHYTYGGQLNLMTQSEYRTLAYDNDLYDLYLSLPASQRFDARIFRRALKMANARFYHFMSANHGYPAGYSTTQKALRNFLDRAKRKIGYGRSGQPGFNIKYERTWLPADHLLRAECSDLVVKLKDSAHLDALDFLDRDRLRKDIAQWESGQLEGDQFYLNLLSIDRFLRRMNGA